MLSKIALPHVPAFPSITIVPIQTHPSPAYSSVSHPNRTTQMASSTHILSSLEAATKALSQANSENHIKYARERARLAAKALRRVSRATGQNTEEAEAEALKLVAESIAALEKAAHAEATTMRELKDARKGLLARGTYRDRKGLGGASVSRNAGRPVSANGGGGAWESDSETEIASGPETGEMEVRSLGYERLGETRLDSERPIMPKRQNVSEYHKNKSALRLGGIAERDFAVDKEKQYPRPDLFNPRLQKRSLGYGPIGQMRPQGERDIGSMKRIVGEKDKGAMRSPLIAENGFAWKKAKYDESVDKRDADPQKKLWEKVMFGETGAGGELDNAIRKRSVSEKEKMPMRSEKMGEKDAKGEKVTWEQERVGTKVRLDGEIKSNPYLSRRE